MAQEASTFFFFPFLVILIFCSHGTMVCSSHHASGNIGSLKVQVSVADPKVITSSDSIDGFAQKELKAGEKISHDNERKLLSRNHLKTTLHDLTKHPGDLPRTSSLTVPITTTQRDTSAPSFVTIPAEVTPTNPNTPGQVPSTTPVTMPPANPTTSPAPVNNPVTSYPPPAGTVPVSPVTNPTPPSSTTNPPGTSSGGSWCVAKSGAPQNALQSALDYACGIGGVDCSQIQQGASCYNPNTLQNHASYAFNSYYQKHPGPNSCSFGGNAMLTNTNPSSGSCIFPSSSTSASSSSPPSPTSSSTTPPSSSSSSSSTPPSSSSSTLTPPSMPTTKTPPATTTSPPKPPGTGFPGLRTAPTALNSSNPTSTGATGFGTDAPPSVTTSDSDSASSALRPLIGCVIMGASFVTGKLVLGM